MFGAGVPSVGIGASILAWKMWFSGAVDVVVLIMCAAKAVLVGIA